MTARLELDVPLDEPLVSSHRMYQKDPRSILDSTKKKKEEKVIRKSIHLSNGWKLYIGVQTLYWHTNFTLVKNENVKGSGLSFPSTKRVSL